MSDRGQHFFDRPRNVTWLLRAFYAVCAMLLAADFVYHRHVTHAFEAAPGFYALFGLAACVALVLAAKEMRKVLMRGEDYYERGDDPGDGNGEDAGDGDSTGDGDDH